MTVEVVRHSLLEAQAALENLLANDGTLRDIDQAASAMTASLRAGGKVMSCGNGGSLCDANHFAEELSGRFRRDRRALAAVSISDPAHMSCVANDFGYEFVFSRFVEAHGKPHDCLLAISTSGASPSILNAALTARDQGLTVIGLTGKPECRLAGLADICISTPAGKF